ncbi:MAG: hypothetical protein JXM70_28135 [Pirellulales bacterium]|nr:hypothetical protein [Pirellulales bacterium]
MAKHTVSVDIPPSELHRADAVFTVMRDGKKYGTLHVSHASLVWIPSHNSIGLKMTWEKFDEFFRTHATRYGRRSGERNDISHRCS